MGIYIRQTHSVTSQWVKIKYPPVFFVCQPVNRYFEIYIRQTHSVTSQWVKKKTPSRFFSDLSTCQQVFRDMYQTCWMSNLSTGKKKIPSRFFLVCQPVNRH